MSITADTCKPPASSGGGSVSGGEGNLAAADIRPPLQRSRSKSRKERIMLRALREQYDIEDYTAKLITDAISLDLQPDVIRGVAAGMIEKLRTIMFPGNPATHFDDVYHNQFVNSILQFAPGNYRRSLANLTKDQSDWMAHYTTLHSLMPMLWLLGEYSPSDAAHAYKGYDKSRCMLSTRCIPLVKVFLKSLRYSLSRSSGIAYENFNSPMHYVPWITAVDCWVVDIFKFYYDVYDHPSPDFKCFNPAIHYSVPNDEDIRNIAEYLPVALWAKA